MKFFHLLLSIVGSLLILFSFDSLDGASLVEAKQLAVRLVNGTVVKLWPANQDPGTYFGCEHTRASVVDCIIRYIDTDHNAALDVNELDTIMTKYLTGFEKLISWIAAEKSYSIMERCDLNQNGLIDLDDLQVWNRDCMAISPADIEQKSGICLCSCRAIDSIHYYVCDRARAEEIKHRLQ